MGTYHFAQDDSYDILSPQAQAALEQLTQRIVAAGPDKIFLERQPEFDSQNGIRDLYQEFRRGEGDPIRNEFAQVGFRAAAALEHDQIYLCDHPGQYGRFYRAARDYAMQHGQMPLLEGTAARTTVSIEGEVDEQALRAERGLLGYLRWLNSDAVRASSHAGYITTFPRVGSTGFYDYDDEQTLIGAELLVDWYRRNIMIYAKILNQVTESDDAIFVLLGSDHIPILEQLFEDHPYFEVIPAAEWLGP